MYFFKNFVRFSKKVSILLKKLMAALSVNSLNLFQILNTLKYTKHLSNRSKQEINTSLKHPIGAWFDLKLLYLYKTLATLIEIVYR